MRKFFISLICLFLLFVSIHMLGEDLFYTIILVATSLLIFFLVYDIKIWFFYFLFILPLLYQVYLVFSNSSTTLVNLGLCFILFIIALIIRIWRVKRLVVELDYFIITILVLLLYLAFSTLFVSSNQSYGMNKYIYFLASILVLMLPSYLFSSVADLRKIVIALFAVGLVYSIAAYMQYFDFFANLSNSTSIRFHLFSMNPIFFARDSSYSILAVIFLIIKFSKDIQRNLGKLTLLLIILFSLSFFMALTGSRGPLLALFISILVSLSIYQRKSNSTKELIFINLIVLVSVSIILYHLLPEDILQRLTSGDINNQRTSIIRLFAILEGLNNFKQNILFGVGFGAYEFTTITFGKISYPHNIFIELLSETGVIGITLFSIILVSTIRMLRKLYERMDLFSFLFVLSIFITSFINANFSGHIGFNLMFWFSCGLIYSIAKLYYEK
jgi:O-antigen ligase